MDTLTVAHVLPPNMPVTTDRGGAVERIVLSIADRQALQGHQVTIFSSNEGHSHTRATGVKIQRIQVRLPRPMCDLEYLTKVWWLSRRGNPQILHAHSSPFAAWILGRRYPQKILSVDFFQFKFSRSRIGRSVYRVALQAFDAISSKTQFSAKAMAMYFGLERIPIVIPNGVDRSIFHRGATSQSVRIPLRSNTKRVVLYVGRVTEQKGAHLLRPLASELQEDSIEVVVCGPLGQFHDDQSVDLEPYVAPPIKYLGAINDQDLPAVMAAADLLVLPTLRDEMFGMVLIEAGACGTPAVASDIDGIPEVMGEGGCLFPAGSLPHLLACIRRCLSQEDLLESLSKKAEENSARYEWSRVVEMTLALYQASAKNQPDKAS